MGFIRDFEIWTNQRPRVCNFDISDYIETGIIGNSCTENTRSLDSIDWADSQTTANATHDAWSKAVNEYFLSALAFFYQADYNSIPEQDNFRCITPENYNKIIDLIYGPDGFWEKSFDFDVARLLWWNCLLDPGSPDKRTGTYSDTFRRITGKDTYIDKPFTVNFTNYQTPSYEKYLEFRSKMDPMLASLKIIMQTAFKHPLTDYEIGPEPCPDIIIGTQIWNRCNLKVDKYRNGDPIPEVQDPVAWAALTTGAWCYYNNDPKTENVYGKMYNWYAVNDPRGLAPVGYHIPTDAEWGLLVDYVGGSNLAGGVLKQKNSVNPMNPLYNGGYYCTSWNIPSSSSNERSFTATAAGYRLDDGDFGREHQDAYWWTQTLYDIDSAVNYNMNYSGAGVGRAPASFGTGFSVRVLKGENPVECPDVTIGTQTWTRCNLNTAFYRNGDPIPQVTDPTEWEDLTTGAWCYYDNDPSNEAIYGKLYNWYAINDPRGIAPVGYHVPIKEECNTLIDYLGGSLVAGGKMKRAGTLGVGKWQVPNTDGTNSSLFTALAGGGRNNNGLVFFSITEGALFWTADEKDEQNGIEFNLFYDNGEVPIGFDNKHNGYSVRLVKGETPPLPVCKEITIGTQTWTGCNLDVTTYRNGDVIPQVQDPTEWANLTTGAWCYYNDTTGNNYTYGKLYNWYAVNDPRGLAPEGWHIPTDAEWTTLTNYIGGEFVAGGKLKEAGFNHWNSPNTGATNEFCFTALPGGTRYDIGSYSDIGDYGYWWSSMESSTSNAWYRILGHDSGEANRGGSIKKAGLSVRLVKGEPDPCPDCVSSDITIGAQVWTKCNLDVTTYRNGDIIPEVSDPTQWSNLTTGAWCYYTNDSANGPTYGKLYNWYAVNDSRGLAPDGYHVPTDAEFTTLTDYLGGLNAAGGKMKEVGLCNWIAPNTNATDSSGFTALPGGDRSPSGVSSDIDYYGYWWSSTENSTDSAFYRLLYFNNGNVTKSNYGKKGGLSVRLVKDDVPECPDVTIGTQTWTGCNTSLDTYKNGDPILHITDATEWEYTFENKTGGWCYYNNDPSTEVAYGKIYNAYVLDDPRGFGPDGYHVPSDEEFIVLTQYLGGNFPSGGKLKEAGFQHWLSPNTNATNESNFTALPAGTRSSNGDFEAIGAFTALWSSSKRNEDNTFNRSFKNDNGKTFRDANASTWGLSIRFIKDAPQPPLCTDDVVIFDQTWKRCNLNVTTYRNGESIPEVQDPAVWATLTTGAWCYYNNDPSTESVYGKLYNWYAVNDSRGLAPDGWKIPTVNDWTELITLNGFNYTGEYLKEVGTEHWHPSSVNGGNYSLFTGRPGGYRDYASGNFYSITYEGYWWSAIEKDTDTSWYYNVHYNTNNISKNSFNKGDALSVRVLKELQQCDVVIGTQTWACKNLSVSRYRNGDIIPQVEDPAMWQNLTIGVWCYYNNDPSTEETYGRLYNWYAVNDPRGLAPTGYHVPSDTEWTTLTDYLGGENIAGGKMKEVGLNHWLAPNTGATDESGFTGLPGGNRNFSGYYYGIGSFGNWWSSTEDNAGDAWTRTLSNSNGNAFRDYGNKGDGLSVRLVKD